MMILTEKSTFLCVVLLCIFYISDAHIRPRVMRVLDYNEIKQNTSRIRETIPESGELGFFTMMVSGYHVGHSNNRLFYVPPTDSTPEEEKIYEELLSEYYASSYHTPTHIMKTAQKEPVAPQLSFLHIPKTGSSFTSTVVHYCCPRLSDTAIDSVDTPSRIGPWRVELGCRKCLQQLSTMNGDLFAHFPYMHERQHKNVVTMLRDPISRLISQILHMSTLQLNSVTFGMSLEDAKTMFFMTSVNLFYAWKRNENDPEVLSKIPPSTIENYRRFENSTYMPDKLRSLINNCTTYTSHAKNSSLDYLRCSKGPLLLHPALGGCQTRMIVGRSCVDIIPPSSEEIELAKERLRNSFLYFGIQEYWAESIEMFHLMLGGATYSDELAHRRKTTKTDMGYALKELADSFRVVDPDQELYDFAKDLFHQRAKALRIKLKK